MKKICSLTGALLCGFLIGAGSAKADQKCAEHWKRFRQNRAEDAQLGEWEETKRAQDLLQSWGAFDSFFSKHKKRFVKGAAPAVNGQPTGDFYHAFLRGDDKIVMLIGDVTGHGGKAALDSNLLQQISIDLEKNSAVLGDDPGDFLTEINARFKEAPNQRSFPTVAALSYDPRSGKLKIANAGAPPVLIGHRDGTTTLIPAASHALNILKDVRYRSMEYDLKKDDIVYIATDGLYEGDVRDPKNEYLSLYNYLLELPTLEKNAQLRRFKSPDMVRQARTPKRFRDNMRAAIQKAYDDITEICFQH